MKYLLMALIRVYQWTISPLLGPVCRFYPSCSHYGYQAIARHGAIYGTYLTARRLVRCNPWNAGGVDLVPVKGERPWWSLRHPAGSRTVNTSQGSRQAQQPPTGGIAGAAPSPVPSTVPGAPARLKSPQGA
jgi:hypothetical protein